MPGPCSAPNGDARLVDMSGEERVRLANKRKLDTGKTRLKSRAPEQDSPP